MKYTSLEAAYVSDLIRRASLYGEIQVLKDLRFALAHICLNSKTPGGPADRALKALDSVIKKEQQ
jgi:hypothetical protein